MFTDGQASEGDDHRQAGEDDSGASGADGAAGSLVQRSAGSDLVAVAAHDEQRVVDADGKAEHGREDGRGRAEVDEAGEGRDASDADAHADERGQQRHAGHEQRAEGHDQHDDRDADAEQLGGAGLGNLLHGVTADGDRDALLPRAGSPAVSSAARSSSVSSIAVRS